MPRHSANELMILPDIVEAGRPDAPYHLSDEEAEEWRRYRRLDATGSFCPLPLLDAGAIVPASCLGAHDRGDDRGTAEAEEDRHQADDAFADIAGSGDQGDRLPDAVDAADASVGLSRP
jgi:hypothetical protein